MTLLSHADIEFRLKLYRDIQHAMEWVDTLSRSLPEEAPALELSAAGLAACACDAINLACIEHWPHLRTTALAPAIAALRRAEGNVRQFETGEALE